MIVRVSGKMGKKIHVSPAKSLPADPNPFADWSAHLFTADRVQYILITNTASLYSMVMYGRGITDDSQFLGRITNTMGEFISDDGHTFLFQRLIAPSTACVAFSKPLNRSVTGSMNDLVFQAKVLLIEEEMSPWETSLRLNEVPLSSLKYANPREAFLRLKPSQDPGGSVTR